MDAPPLSSERKRELAELRSRAYGPDADIHLDANALARLRELEDMARADAPPTSRTPTRRTPRPPSPPHPSSRRQPCRCRPCRRLARQRPVAARLLERRRDDRRRSDRAPALVAQAADLGVRRGGGRGRARRRAGGPRPDAAASGRDAQAGARRLRRAGLPDVRHPGESPVRYAPFHDLEVWSAETAQGSVCIVVTTETAEWMTAGCAPEPLKPAPTSRTTPACARSTASNSRTERRALHPARRRDRGVGRGGDRRSVTAAARPRTTARRERPRRAPRTRGCRRCVRAA